MKKILLTVIIIGLRFGYAQDWSANVADIIYKNCSNCHNSNGIAPFQLMSYQDAVDNANDIKDQVTSHKMPPWPPDVTYSRLAHERILTAQQISDIVAWVDNGTARGDSSLEPAAPVFNSANEIASPDLVLQAPVYPVNTNNDLYRCFVVPTNLTTGKYITGIEAVPGNRNVVHHILIYADTTNIPTLLDNADPGPGYTNFGGSGSPFSKLIGVWVPGQTAYFAPAGMGIRLPANCKVIMQIHYPGGITSQTDSTKLLLKLSSTTQREITIESPLSHWNLDNGPLHIDANTTKTFYSHYDITGDMSTLGVGPHMHLIGKKIKSWGVTPSNDTIPFVSIDDWDFHWQGMYSFPRVIKIPSGTTIYSSAFYDNTSANADNPNDPPQDVDFGESTTDEMMLVYFTSTPYMAGDENIIIDSSFYTGIQPVQNSIVTTPQLYDIIPNPSTEKISFQYFLPSPGEVTLSITDLNGKLVKEICSGIVSGLSGTQVEVGELSSGVYFLTLSAGTVNRTKKFVKE